MGESADVVCFFALWGTLVFLFKNIFKYLLKNNKIILTYLILYVNIESRSIVLRCKHIMILFIDF